MSRSHPGTAGIVFIALLAFPRASSAGLMDYIHEMSGPKMVGLRMVECEVYLTGGGRGCDDIVELINRLRKKERGPEPMGFPVWQVRLVVDPTVYWSLPHTSSEGDHYGAGIYMVAAEPIFEFSAGNLEKASFYYGGGFSVAGLFGSGLSPFAKGGFKVRPFGVRINNIGPKLLDYEFEFNARFFPDKFSREDFGFEPRVGRANRPREWVVGVSGTVAF